MDFVDSVRDSMEGRLFFIASPMSSGPVKVVSLGDGRDATGGWKENFMAVPEESVTSWCQWPILGIGPSHARLGDKLMSEARCEFDKREETFSLLHEDTLLLRDLDFGLQPPLLSFELGDYSASSPAYVHHEGQEEPREFREDPRQLSTLDTIGIGYEDSLSSGANSWDWETSEKAFIDTAEVARSRRLNAVVQNILDEQTNTADTPFLSTIAIWTCGALEHFTLSKFLWEKKATKVIFNIFHSRDRS